MWFSSSAGVSTSLSSMKSTSSACKTSASVKWPMRTLAITGMVTVFMISRMILMDAMRATPPSLRMSDGTRSSAITAQAPAFSAICACSALVTSIITPPLSISARPTFTRHSLAVLPPFPLPFPFFEPISPLLSAILSKLCAPLWLNSFFADYHKSRFTAGQNIACRIPYLANVKKVPPFLLAFFPAFHNNFVLHANRLEILDRKLRGYGANFAKPANLPHRFIKERSNNASVPHAPATLIPLPQNKSPNNPASLVVLHEHQLHAGVIRAATAEAAILWIRRQRDCGRLCFLCARCALHSVSSVSDVGC